MAVDDPSNPWSRSGWNVTAQGEYYKRMGKAGAERKAKEAGTFLGGPKPPPPEGDAKPEIRNYVMHQRRSESTGGGGGDGGLIGAGSSGDGPPS